MEIVVLLSQILQYNLYVFDFIHVSNIFKNFAEKQLGSPPPGKRHVYAVFRYIHV